MTVKSGSSAGPIRNTNHFSLTSPIQHQAPLFVGKMRLLRVFVVVVASAVLARVEAGNLRGSVQVPDKDCGAPPSVYQGSVKYSSTKPGSSATYSCMKGAQLKGPSTIRCTNQGIWSPQSPECRVTYLASKDNTFKNMDKGYALYSG